jgi:hypothetical protein
MLLESYQRGLQLYFRPHPNPRLKNKVMRSQSCKSPNVGNFETKFGNPKTKCYLDVGLVERHRIYYKGEGGGFPKFESC